MHDDDEDKHVTDDDEDVFFTNNIDPDGDVMEDENAEATFWGDPSRTNAWLFGLGAHRRAS